VTRFAFPGSWLVEEDSFAIHFARQLVTTVASNPAMSAFERKWRTLVVVKFRRFPARCVVAIGAACCIFARGKLVRMWIIVASRALFRSRAKVHIFQVALKRCGAMAIAAGHSAMRAQERKFRFRMVKLA